MKSSQTKVDRRKFLTGVAVAGATAATVTKADAAPTPVNPGKLPAALPPTAHQIAVETGAVVDSGQKSHGRPGSDFMLDVIKSLKFEYCYSNPASSFRGLHESMINYGKNSMPEFITCMHEESATAMCHGHFKATGKPQMMLCHGTVGLMHATMAVYNAWCDRVPLMIVGGNDLDAAKRPPGVPTYHSAQDIGVLVRDYTKWDDAPVSHQHFAQSFVRAYKAMMTPPYGPVLISLDAGIQDTPIEDPKLTIPKYSAPNSAQADVGALRETAKLLVNAESPVIVVDRVARNQEGIQNLITLAELLQVPVVDQGGRMNFPNGHHLNQTQGGQTLIRNADVILGLECSDFWNTVNQWIDNGENHGHGLQEKRIKPNAKLITISGVDLLTKSNFQDFQRYQPVDIAMAGDSQTSLPALIEAVRSAIPADKKAAFEKRGEQMKEAWKKDRDRLRQQAALGWDANPISTARLCSETYAAIKDLDWSLVQGGNIRGWAQRMFNMDKHYRFLGVSGGSGLGYGLPASVGGAHGNKGLGRFSVSFQGDGDMMYAPGALWTAAHHEIPLLTVMHNNRGYHQEVMHVQRMSNRRNRLANLGKDLGPIGTRIENPNVDYAQLAKSMGVWSMGPISDPKELGPALKKAVDVVKSGQPALLDTVTQPR
jgi:thiamine pyrophosphate-dependent acetolactate synthase large subunit-like protein